MGSRVGHHSVIGAGAVVLEDTVIPPYSLVVGVPARIVRDLRAGAASRGQGRVRSDSDGARRGGTVSVALTTTPELLAGASSLPPARALSS